MYCPVYNSQGEREYRHLNIFYNLLSVTGSPPPQMLHMMISAKKFEVLQSWHN